MAPQQTSTNQDALSLQEPLVVASETPATAISENTLTGENRSRHDDSRYIVVPASCLTCGRQIALNHNVWLNLITTALYGVGTSLSNGTAYAAYLKRIGNGMNSPLGDIEAVGGLASLIAALPMGYLADRHGKSKVISSGGILLLLVSALQIWVMEWIKQDGQTGGISNASTALWLFGAIMAGFGVCDGVVNGPSQALYADSTPEGQRSVFYTYLFSCYAISSCVGPLVSIVMFQTIGDDWDIFHLKLVIYVGLGFGILNGFTMLLYDDSKALDEQSNSGDNNSGGDQWASDANDEQDNVEQGAIIGDVPNADASESIDEGVTNLRKRQKWIPYILFLAGLIMSIGSGMTVKFFPLFFKDEVGMTPSQVQLIYVCVPLSMTAFSYVCSGLAAAGFGRVQSALLMSVLGICCLFSMVIFRPYMDKHPVVLVPIYILRTGLMNCSYPLVESILMDFVPKEERARWKSLESVSAFGWCGSAAMGGWLADKYDYTYTFLITALLQTFGMFIFSLLIPLVPRQEGERNHADQQSDARDDDRQSGPLQATQASSTGENPDLLSSGIGTACSEENDPLHQPLLSDHS